MNQYEIAVIYHPDLEAHLSKGEERVQKIVADNGGKVISNDNWGKRKLAYPIKGSEHGVYVFYTVELPGTVVSKVENTLNITDEIIRFLITRIDHKAIAKAEAAKAVKAEQAAKRGERGDEEDKDEEKED
ncbi:MAG TPA: 30S ribosomal protein S6 [Candidatus Saccharimonadales bacterium]|nr:30S ribosomal protein S6 [Candidatus Saccharimonadales bacterium]